MPKKQKSFTVIELLVVVAIVGLLVSIILIAMRGSTDKARLAKIQQYSASIKHALSAYILAEWNFDTDTVPSTIRDTSGNNVNGVGVTLTLTSDGLEKQGIIESAVNSKIRIIGMTSAKMNSTSGAYTEEIWVKTPTASANTTFMARALIFYFNYNVDYGTGEEAISVIAYDATGTACPATYYNGDFSPVPPIITKPGQWNHFVGTYDGKGNASAYINGILVVTTTRVTGALKTQNIMAEVARLDSGGPITIDEIRLYDSALTFSQIQQLYAEGAERHGIATNN